MKNLKIVVARHDTKSFNEYLRPCLDILRSNPIVKIAEIFNEKDDSIFKKYNPDYPFEYHSLSKGLQVLPLLRHILALVLLLAC